MKTEPEISVVICTYNRPDLLKLAIKSLILQSLEKTRFEIIIIDNGNLEKTKQTVEYFQKKYSGYTLRFFREFQVGLSYARNTGILKSRGKYVAFIDDDAQMPVRWLHTALILFQTVKPAPLAVGGPEKPIIRSKKPEWFKEEYFSPTVGILGKKSRFLKKGQSLNGSNMIIRKSVLQEFGNFDGTIGMKGEYISLHEETSFFEKLWKLKRGKGIFIYYSPKLVFRHLILDFKLSPVYISRRSFASGQAWFAKLGKVGVIKRFMLISASLLYLAVQSVISLASFFFYKMPEQWIIEKVSKVFFGFGFLLGVIGISINTRQR